MSNRLNTTNTNNTDMQEDCVRSPECIKDEPIPASVQYIYEKLSFCYHTVFTLRQKLEFLIEGKGEFPYDETAYPLQANPAMPTIKQLSFDIEQQLALCSQLVNILRDGGHLK